MLYICLCVCVCNILDIFIAFSRNIPFNFSSVKYEFNFHVENPTKSCHFLKKNSFTNESFVLSETHLKFSISKC